MNTKCGKWIIAITGASGIRYGLRLLDVAASLGNELHVVFSEAGMRVLREEEGLAVSFSNLSTQILIGRECENVHFYNPRDIGAVIASGSALFDGMVVVPCTMGTLAAIANGICDNLIHRAADVTLKERRKLIMVPRETPLSTIHIENMLRVSQAGATLLPAMPGFYHRPASIEDLVDMLVMKILDQMGIQQNLVERWKEESPSESQSTKVVVGTAKFAC